MSVVQSQQCVNLAMLPPDVWAELQAEDFTVQRNSREAGESRYSEESGWRIQQKRHSTICSGRDTKTGPTDSIELGDAVATKYAKGERDVWRVFMNKSRGDGHNCGWRECDPTVRSFWPTRCKMPMEKEAWWAWFDEQLNSLPLWSQVFSKRITILEG